MLLDTAGCNATMGWDIYNVDEVEPANEQEYRFFDFL